MQAWLKDAEPLMGVQGPSDYLKGVALLSHAIHRSRGGKSKDTGATEELKALQKLMEPHGRSPKTAHG